MQKLKLTSLLATVIMGFMATTGMTRAALVGANVHLAIHYPDVATPFYDYGSANVIDPGYEFGEVFGWRVDITDTQMKIIRVGGGGTTLSAPGGFNGWILTINSGPTISSASLNSGVVPVSISVLNGNQLLVDVQDITYGQNDATVIDIVTVPVPEPSTYLAGGLLALVAGVQGWRSYRSRKQVA